MLQNVTKCYTNSVLSLPHRPHPSFPRKWESTPRLSTQYFLLSSPLGTQCPKMTHSNEKIPTPSASSATSAVSSGSFLRSTLYFLPQEQPSMNPTPGTQNPSPGVGEVPVYCDCCPHRPKKMAVIQPDAIQIISRRSGRKHIARIPLTSTPHPSHVTQ